MAAARGAPLLRWRHGSADDVPLLAALYAASARGIGPARYSAEQVAVWSAFGEDLPAFAAWLVGSSLLIALDERDAPIGFCAVDDDGHVHGLYLAPAHAGAGLGLQLLRLALEQRRACGIDCFHADATHLSRSVFERAGFSLVAARNDEYRGVRFELFGMSTT